MRELFEEQLQLLNQELTEMGCLCEEIISMASQALVSYDEELGQKVSKVGAKIDEEERTIEAICMRLLLRQQPVASDLRQISAAMKMITDMERIGDQADDIAEIILSRGDRLLTADGTLRAMARAAIRMVSESVDAYVRQDVALAERVIASDDEVDEDFDRIKRRLIDGISSGTEDGESVLDLVMIAKYYERIADHATNIAEWVEFSVTGVHKTEIT